MKNFVYKIIRTIIILLGVFPLFSSCNIGLGSAVDLQAPELELTSHKDNDTVAEKFTLTGTAFDNVAVTKITIDFDDADIHYIIEPGKNWFKKTSASEQWIEIPESATNYCKAAEKGWNWSVDVDTADKIASKNDTNYSFTANVKDEAGNTSGKKTQINCTLVVDVESPSVSIQQPELLAGVYSSIKDDADIYKLKDGNCIAKLLNGKIEISGRVDQSISFKGLRIDFDNGQVKSGIRKSTLDSTASVNSIDDIIKLNDASLGDLVEPKIYCTKILEETNLRTWTLTVNPEDLINSENGKADHLETGKHIIRVVSTCLSGSNTWERKILGYFVWWPEADKPWITVSVCDDEDKDYDDPTKYAGFPGGSISGSCQDDDGIKKFVTTLYKKVDGEYQVIDEKTHINLEANNEISKYSAFSVEVPSENGSYKIDFKLIDLYGNEDSLTKYFKTSDVSAPKIEILSPKENSSAIQNAEGNVTFNVKATDDGAVKTFALVWLNPAKANDVANKIHYLTGSEEYWGKVTTDGFIDENGNKLYLLLDGGTKKEENVTKTLNLYSDLNIDGHEKKLVSQEFIFYASDGNSSSIRTITLTGDTHTPVLTFDRIKIGSQDYSLETPPTFKKLTASDTTAVISGKWSDSFNESITNTNKFTDFTVKWDSNQAEVQRNADGTWTATLTPPVTGGTITAILSDFAGNKKTVQSAASIEATDLSLARVGCNEDDGAYTTGRTLNLTLEFTKNTDVDVTGGKPTLTLNNGGTAVYSSGSGTPVHVYEYTIAEGNSDVEKLSVTSLISNGAKWYDSAVEKNESNAVQFSINTNVANLDKTRAIAIDKTKPTVKSITSLAASGYYKAGAQIPLMLEFSEDVTIENPENLALNFDHNSAKTSTSSVSGSRYVLFTYVVGATDYANPLTFSSVSHTSVIIKDNAGNNLENWTPSASSFTGIVIDTTKPSAPSFGTWNPLPLITDASGTRFTLSGEEGAVIEYSIDGGASWLPYTGTVTLKNNGDYNVTARQTDVAGNVSENAAIKSFTIDAGELLTKITANTPSGTYSTNTSTNKIEGRIEFRKAVKIAQGATVTLNIGSGKNVPINECVGSDAENSVFTFDYTIVAGDVVTKLDVTEFSFASVEFKSNSGYTTVPVTIPAENSGNPSGKRFAENRDISILTGTPVVVANGISFTGAGKDAVLTVEFDRPVTKLSGDITFTYNTTENDFHVPAVLSASEYNELNKENVLSAYYEAGNNGAILNGTTLTNDTSIKYILKTTVSDTTDALVKVFTDAGKHRVTIPVISDQVEVTSKGRGIDSNNKMLRVTLGSAYALPVKGAKYTLSIPARAVVDAVNNENDEKIEIVTATGVEAPVIRIVRPSYEINITKGENPPVNKSDIELYTKNSTVDISQVQTATMYLSCRTPDASIMYGLQSTPSTAVTVHSNPINVNTTKTNDVDVPAVVNTPYRTRVSLGGNNAVNTYANAQGLKIAIAAKAVKEGFDDSDLSYEYATRTVVKFNLAHYRDSMGDTGHGGTGNPFQGLWVKDLRPWICGGDSSYGPNSSSTFPLAWSDSKKFQMMAGLHNNDDTILGQYWWVSWDITAKTYIGFVAGNVPADANENGPNAWFVGDYHWTLIKDQYPLYPGETLIMSAINEEECGKNGATSFIPMGAKFAFNAAKYFTR